MIDVDDGLAVARSTIAAKEEDRLAAVKEASDLRTLIAGFQEVGIHIGLDPKTGRVLVSKEYRRVYGDFGPEDWNSAMALVRELRATLQYAGLWGDGISTHPIGLLPGSIPA